jgi:hypothetical protein
MSKIEDVVYIEAIVERAVPERTEFKPYRTELVFEGKIKVRVPVPRKEVIKYSVGSDNTAKGEVILTLQGWTAFLKNYADAVEEMNRNYQNQFR